MKPITEVNAIPKSSPMDNERYPSFPSYEDNSLENKNMSFIEPVYIMTLELEKNKSRKIEIFPDSNPAELAFEFCKENNLDFASLNCLTIEIENLLEKFVTKEQMKSLSHLVNTDKQIPEVDEEKSFTEKNVTAYNNDEKINIGVQADYEREPWGDDKLEIVNEVNSLFIKSTVSHININITNGNIYTNANSNTNNTMPNWRNDEQKRRAKSMNKEGGNVARGIVNVNCLQMKKMTNGKRRIDSKSPQGKCTGNNINGGLGNQRLFFNDGQKDYISTQGVIMKTNVNNTETNASNSKKLIKCASHLQKRPPPLYEDNNNTETLRKNKTIKHITNNNNYNDDHPSGNVINSNSNNNNTSVMSSSSTAAQYQSQQYKTIFDKLFQEAEIKRIVTKRPCHFFNHQRNQTITPSNSANNNNNNNPKQKPIEHHNLASNLSNKDIHNTHTNTNANSNSKSKQLHHQNSLRIFDGMNTNHNITPHSARVESNKQYNVYNTINIFNSSKNNPKNNEHAYQPLITKDQKPGDIFLTTIRENSFKQLFNELCGCGGNIVTNHNNQENTNSYNSNCSNQSNMILSKRNLTIDTIPIEIVTEISSIIKQITDGNKQFTQGEFIESMMGLFSRMSFDSKRIVINQFKQKQQQENIRVGSAGSLGISASQSTLRVNKSQMIPCEESIRQSTINTNTRHCVSGKIMHPNKERQLNSSKSNKILHKDNNKKNFYNLFSK